MATYSHVQYLAPGQSGRRNWFSKGACGLCSHDRICPGNSVLLQRKGRSVLFEPQVRTFCVKHRSHGDIGHQSCQIENVLENEETNNYAYQLLAYQISDMTAIFGPGYLARGWK